MEENNSRPYYRFGVRLFGSLVFRWLCFFLGVLLVSWPFLVSLDYSSFRLSLAFYFTLWLGLILVIAITHIFSKEEDESPDDRMV
ncbi:MAG: hypothetical protein WAU28_02835 [Candidatus Moraniibacteriota bacterium]